MDGCFPKKLSRIVNMLWLIWDRRILIICMCLNLYPIYLSCPRGIDCRFHLKIKNKYKNIEKSEKSFGKPKLILTIGVYSSNKD